MWYTLVNLYVGPSLGVALAVIIAILLLALYRQFMDQSIFASVSVRDIAAGMLIVNPVTVMFCGYT